MSQLNEEVQYWEDQYKMCEKARMEYEKTWYYHMAFYFGKQYIAWIRVGNMDRLQEPPMAKNRVRLIVNKTRRVVRNEITKFTKEEPHFYVIPNTTEPTDVAAAKVGESIADYVLHSVKYNKVRRSTAFWQSIAGVGFTKNYIDGGIDGSGKDGEIVIEPITPHHIFVPHLHLEELQAQPYAMLCRAIDPGIVEKTYGVAVDPDVDVSGNLMEQKLHNALGIKNSQGTKPHLIYVKEVWVKSGHPKYPNGAMLVIANDKIIYRYGAITESTEKDDNGDPIAPDNTWVSDFPYEHGELPFTKFDHIPAGRFYASSVLEDFIPLQKEYNRTRSQMVEHKNLVVKPQYAYQKGSLDAKKWNGTPGLLIPINTGYDKPSPIEHPPMPNSAAEELQFLQGDMDELSLSTDINRGNTPVGVEAASAIAYLQEENDSVLHPTISSIEEATQDIGKQVLELVQQYWSEEKIIEVVSKNSAFEAMIFKISKLNKNTDIRVEAGSMAPKSRAARQAFITDLMDKGLMPPDKGLMYLQMAETSRLYEELQVDSRQALRENLKMTMGIAVPTNEWDDLETHMYEHAKYMKSQEFETLDPETIQLLFVTHYKEHQMRQMVAMGQEATMGEDPNAEGTEDGTDVPPGGEEVAV